LYICSTKPRDWLGRTSPKWPIFCLLERKTLTQSSRLLSWLIHHVCACVCVTVERVLTLTDCHMRRNCVSVLNLEVSCCSVILPALISTSRISGCMHPRWLKSVETLKMLIVMSKFHAFGTGQCPWTRYVFRLSVHCVRSFVPSSKQILLQQYLMNAFSNFDKTAKEYTLAPTDDLIRFWRSKVKCQGYHRSSRWQRHRRQCWGAEIYFLVSFLFFKFC